MREIKFRVWDKRRRDMITSSSNHYISLQGYLYWQFGFDTFDPLRPGEYDVEQYTGLKDKNGKEMYEGDIVDMDGDVGAILWEEREASFIVKGKGWDTNCLSRNDILVIGNIHENQ